MVEWLTTPITELPKLWREKRMAKEMIDWENPTYKFEGAHDTDLDIWHRGDGGVAFYVSGRSVYLSKDALHALVISLLKIYFSNRKLND